MSSPDQLAASPGDLETAAAQLGNDAQEARGVVDSIGIIENTLPEPETGLSVRDALFRLRQAYGSGFTTIATELDGLAGQVVSSAQLLVLVDNNAAGYFTASDAI